MAGLTPAKADPACGNGPTTMEEKREQNRRFGGHTG